MDLHIVAITKTHPFDSREEEYRQASVRMLVSKERERESFNMNCRINSNIFVDGRDVCARKEMG